jgi:hypothetical protein
VSVALLTVAVNCWVAPRITLGALGEMTAATAGIVTVAEADLVLSACAVARIVTDDGVLRLVGAVYKPADDIVPEPLTVQVTAEFVLPVTVAVNCRVAPATTVAVTGVTATVIVGGGGGGEDLLPPPHAASMVNPNTVTKIRMPFITASLHAEANARHCRDLDPQGGEMVSSRRYCRCRKMGRASWRRRQEQL